MLLQYSKVLNLRLLAKVYVRKIQTVGESIFQKFRVKTRNLNSNLKNQTIMKCLTKYSLFSTLVLNITVSVGQAQLRTSTLAGMGKLRTVSRHHVMRSDLIWLELTSLSSSTNG